MFWSKITSIFKEAPYMSSLLNTNKNTSGSHADLSIKEIITSKDRFEDFVYTNSLEEAISILNKRRSDTNLQKKVSKYFSKVGIPEPFLNEPRLTIFRQVATPNIEISRFLIAADGAEIKPLFIEYLHDKFTSNNEWKRYLGKIAFYEGVGKKGGDKINYKTIIDFNSFDGEKIGDVKTLWGQKLHEFHRSLFHKNYSHITDDLFFEGSEWFKKCGGKAEKYYDYFIALFVLNGILFENFLLDHEDEYDFSEKIFLPSMQKVIKYFGVKPLIVPISPTNIETAEFWLCHNPKTKKWFEDNIKTQ